MGLKTPFWKKLWKWFFELDITVLFPQAMLHYLSSACFTDLKIKSSEMWKESAGTDNSCFFFSLQFFRTIPFTPSEESPDIFIFLAESKSARALARLFDYQMTFWLGMSFLCSLSSYFHLSLVSFAPFLSLLSPSPFTVLCPVYFPLSKTNTIPDNFRLFTLGSHSSIRDPVMIQLMVYPSPRCVCTEASAFL